MKGLTGLLSLIKLLQVYVDLHLFFTACKMIGQMYMHKLPVTFGDTVKLK